MNAAMVVVSNKDSRFTSHGYRLFRTGPLPLLFQINSSVAHAEPTSTGVEVQQNEFAVVQVAFFTPCTRDDVQQRLRALVDGFKDPELDDQVIGIVNEAFDALPSGTPPPLATPKPPPSLPPAVPPGTPVN